MTTAALAAITPVLPAVPAKAQVIPPTNTLLVDLVNRLAGQQFFAHITGLDRTSGKWFFLAAAAKLRVYPGSPAAMTPLPATGIRLDAAGTPKRADCPGRGQRPNIRPCGPDAEFFVNPGGGIVVPSVTNPADPNADVRWASCEFTLDGNAVYANISFVDLGSLALSLTLYTATGQQQHVGGLIPNGLARSSYAVFNCGVPPFVTSNDIMGNLTARSAPGLNRGTLLANARQPDATAAGIYRAAVTNHCPRLVHSATAGGAGYAFPYDDVHADGLQHRRPGGRRASDQVDHRGRLIG